jgi:diaminopimelate decarboxylase
MGIDIQNTDKRTKSTTVNDDKQNTLKKLSSLKPFIDYASKNQRMILESVKKYGTPQYLLDENLFLENLTLLKSSFQKSIPKSRLFYAFKSNDLPYIVGLLKNNGVNADVSCMFEMQLALKIGFKDIIYTAPYKSDDEIIFAIKNNVVLNIDNVVEFQKIIAVCQKYQANAKISFRIRNMGKSWNKFGINTESFVSMAKTALKTSGLSWVGIHFHSSWNVNSQLYESNLKMISDCLKNNFTHKELSSLRFIDIGGGLMPFESVSINEDFVMPSNIKKFAEDIGKAVKTYILDKLDINPEIWLEPGRMICSTSTMILLKVDS